MVTDLLGVHNVDQHNSLGPTVCPHRHPLGGRNFESFSEDPLLTGRLASQYIRGLQDQGVGATIKHFAVNEQETKRFTMNANVSEKALREIYLKPFEIAIKEAKPWALMTSYNSINGKHADANDVLLQTILREEWGWRGWVQLLVHCHKIRKLTISLASVCLTGEVPTQRLNR